MDKHVLVCKAWQLHCPLAKQLLAGSAAQLCLLHWGKGGGEALSLPRWNDAEYCRQSSPSFIAGSLWATTSCSGLSVHLSLVQLDRYKLILLNILFPVNLMWQKGVFFLCASSFLAVIILSQMRDFLLVQGYYGSSFRGE